VAAFLKKSYALSLTKHALGYTLGNFWQAHLVTLDGAKTKAERGATRRGQKATEGGSTNRP
jgi:hypothetical protein